MIDQAYTLVGLAIGLSILGGIFWRRLSPVVEMAQQLHGEPGDEERGIPARPGILQRQTATEKAQQQQAAEMAELRADNAELRKMLTEVVAALRNNGGSSVKDIVDKTYAAVTAATQ